MSIVIEKYTRKPFQVEAIRVTDKNMDEVAEWCGGTIHTRNGKRYIQVDVINPLTEKQTKAFSGNWLLQTKSGFKVYTHRAFQDAFDKDEVQHPQQDSLFGDNTEIERPEPKIHFPKDYPAPSTR